MEKTDFSCRRQFIILFSLWETRNAYVHVGGWQRDHCKQCRKTESILSGSAKVIGSMCLLEIYFAKLTSFVLNEGVKCYNIALHCDWFLQTMHFITLKNKICSRKKCKKIFLYSKNNHSTKNNFFLLNFFTFISSIWSNNMPHEDESSCLFLLFSSLQ